MIQAKENDTFSLHCHADVGIPPVELRFAVFFSFSSDFIFNQLSLASIQCFFLFDSLRPSQQFFRYVGRVFLC